MPSHAVVAAAALSLAAGSAFAACERPTPPAIPAPEGATMEQVLAAKAQAAAFITASDAYQTCVLDDIDAQKAAAKKAKVKFDSAINKAGQAQVDANQADKVKVGAAFNALVKAYRAAHPS